MNTKQFHCSNCGSTQLLVQQRGLDTNKAIIGDIIAGPIGILAASVGGSENVITCLTCGNVFYPDPGGQFPDKISAQTPVIKPIKERASQDEVKVKKGEPINETFQEVFSVILFFAGIVIIGLLLYKRFF